MKTIVYGIAAFVALVMSSCDGKVKLAENISGEWSQGGQNLVVAAQNVVHAVINDEEFSFVPSSKGAIDGNVLISSMIDLTVLMPFDGQVVEGIDRSIAAMATISGTYMAIDDDELLLKLDMSTLNVAIDSASVVLTTNVVDKQDNVATKTLSPTQILQYEQTIARALKDRYSLMRRLDDVKVKDNGAVLKFEYSDVDVVLTKVI